MSSISSVQSYGSPLQRLQTQLGSEIQAGTVKASDSDALTSALKSIDSSLRSDRSAESAPTRPDPSTIKSKIDDLIKNQVSSGTLTSDQAEELKTVFAAAAPAGGPGSSGAAGGGREAGAPPPPPPPQDGTDGAQASRAKDTSDTDRDALIQRFVDQLRQSVASGYSAGGAATRSSRALVFDLSA